MIGTCGSLSAITALTGSRDLSAGDTLLPVINLEEIKMTVEFNKEFNEEVLVILEDMCQTFLESVPFQLATRLTEKYPELGHFSVMQAVDRFVQPDGDGSRDKAKEWLEFRARDITEAFEAEFNQDEDLDEDDDYPDYEDSQEEGGRYFHRNIVFKSDPTEVMRVQFCRWDDYIENDPEDEATFFYGLSPDVAVVGYDGGDWMIVE